MSSAVDSACKCHICRSDSHTAESCLNEFVPNLIIHCTPIKRNRIIEYINELYNQNTNINNNNNNNNSNNSNNKSQYSFRYLVPVQHQDLILTRCSNPQQFSRDLQSDKAINRYILCLFPCTNTTKSLTEIISLDELKNKTLRIQAFPKHIISSLVDKIESLDSSYNIELHPKTFTHVLHVVHIASFFLYALDTKENFYKQDTFFGNKQNSKENENININTNNNNNENKMNEEDNINLAPKDVICRAYYKLSEIFALESSLHLDSDMKALDVGAAPGGWSSYLANRGVSVLAIDPAVLTIPPNPKIVHLQKKFEDCTEEIKKFSPVNILVCDMNIAPMKAASLLITIHPYLAENCLLIFTIKELFRGSKQRSADESITILSSIFTDFQTRHLLANGREKTLTGKRKQIIDVDQINTALQYSEQLRKAAAERKALKESLKDETQIKLDAEKRKRKFMEKQQKKHASKEVKSTKYANEIAAMNARDTLNSNNSNNINMSISNNNSSS